MAVVHEHTVVTIGDIAYYVRPRSEVGSAPILRRSSPQFHWPQLTISTQKTGIVSEPPGSGINNSVKPATVVHLGCSDLTRKALEDVFSRIETEDDVFQRAFFAGGTVIVELPAGVTSCAIPDDVDTFLQSQASDLIFSSTLPPIPEGPYLIKGTSLHQVWRLYEDDLFSFISAVVPADGGDEETTFRPLPVSAYGGVHLVVAVPSRLYSPKDKSKPLNGCRITVKDNFHLAGAVTTMGSRSFAAYYGVQNETSAYVKELVSKGAVILGKIKMGAYTGLEAPPEKSIDYLPPFNPHGDGYQGPSGSSMAAAASVSGYDWVDISLGTDSKWEEPHPLLVT